MLPRCLGESIIAGSPTKLDKHTFPRLLSRVVFTKPDRKRL